MKAKPKIEVQWPPEGLFEAARLGKKPSGAARIRVADYNAHCAGVAHEGFDDHIDVLKRRKKAQITVEFCPPSGVEMDKPCVLKAAIRPGLRGVASVIGVPSDKWRIAYRIGEPVTGGRIRLRLDRLE